MQQVLTLATEQGTVRAKIVNHCQIEDPRLVLKHKPIKATPSVSTPKYPTILHAMADGWELLGPSTPYRGTYGGVEYEWMLVRHIDDGRAPIKARERARLTPPRRTDSQANCDILKSRVLEAVRSGSVTRGTIATALGVTPETITTVLTQLRSRGSLGMMGARRGARYFLPDGSIFEGKAPAREVVDGDAATRVLTTLVRGESLSRGAISRETAIGVEVLTPLLKKLRRHGKIEMAGNRASAVYTLV